MSDPMNAADVLGDIGDSDDFVAALLAHGEQGVAILPAGTLWALEFHGEDYGPGEEDVELFRLVPLSAEAGDTEGPIPSVPSTWMGGGLEITYGSAEAGDTDD
jgi:hypothetical protein